jgi:hypothetical protein
LDRLESLYDLCVLEHTDFSCKKTQTKHVGVFVIAKLQGLGRNFSGLYTYISQMWLPIGCVERESCDSSRCAQRGMQSPSSTRQYCPVELIGRKPCDQLQLAQRSSTSGQETQPMIAPCHFMGQAKDNSMVARCNALPAAT